MPKTIVTTAITTIVDLGRGDIYPHFGYTADRKKAAWSAQYRGFSARNADQHPVEACSKATAAA